jgi:hypothetical protein
MPVLFYRQTSPFFNFGYTFSDRSQTGKHLSYHDNQNLMFSGLFWQDFDLITK